MTWLIVSLVAIGVVAAAVVVYVHWRSAVLRRRFGPEYERAVAAHGGRRPAEAGLRTIARRRDALDVRPLEEPVRAHYRARWREAQLGFVDGPAAAVRQADLLVIEVLHARGYPTDDRDEGTAMVSADHPDLVDGYRAASAVAAEPDGPTDIDRLREAFVHLRDLFDRLVAGPSTDARAGDEHRGDEADDRADDRLRAGERDDGDSGEGRIAVRRSEPELESEPEPERSEP